MEWIGKTVKFKNAFGGTNEYLVKKFDKKENTYSLKGLHGASDMNYVDEKELESRFFKNGGNINSKFEYSIGGL